jgi:alkanesulfonate monooxygenase SsuD/methylene tetrahydromethanopterin reductase-like flavin-dependent oxidoreductase (luciferase family)
VLAKATTTLDTVSEVRLSVGSGSVGYRRSTPARAFHSLGARMEGYLRCLQELWTQDQVEFSTVPRSHVRPRPVQQPHPALLFDRTAEAALRRAGRLARPGSTPSRKVFAPMHPISAR